RRRLVSVPGHLHRPVWIEDPDFDLDHHVRPAVLRPPGGTAELAEFAAEVIRRPLERARPLWEMHVAEGLEGGMVGVVTKMHHATIDGVSGAELAATLLDPDPDPPPVPAPASGWTPERAPSRLTLLRDAGRDLIGQPAAAASGLVRAAAAVLRLRRHGRQDRKSTRLNSSHQIISYAVFCLK